MNKEELKIEGIINNIIFHNEDNGYSVFSVVDEQAENSDDEGCICVGYVPNINSGESISILGKTTFHPSYGEQILIDSYEKNIPTTVRGIEKYLASGAIKGIGVKLARKIVEKFGQNTLAVIEKEPEKLTKIRGISSQKAMDVCSIFHEQVELREAMIALQGYGISSNYALKIYKRYKSETLKIVTTNPYSLAEDIIGIGFKIADDIAKKVGISNEAPFRIKAGIKYALTQAASSGHVFLPLESLIFETSRLINVNSEVIENGVAKLQVERQIFVEKHEEFGNIVFLSSYYYSESYVAKKLLDLSLAAVEKFNYIDDKINEFETEYKITFDNTQKLAIKEALTNGVMVITGGPGTGKTTIINAIISILVSKNKVVELAAPTGRAAKRMSESTGFEAKTIHRLLEISFMSENSHRQTFEKNEENPIEADVVIIDESSMVDILLMSNLLKAIPLGTRLILIGDADQLPSVGPGKVLKNIINSECIKVIRLTEIFRQAAKSAIIVNAHKINKGEYPVVNGDNSDFFFIKKFNIDEVVDTIVELSTKRLPKFLGCENLKDIQVLTPMRKSPLGVQNLNNILQKSLNPPAKHKLEKEFRNVIFRVGDKVMQIKNNYNMQWKVFKNNTLSEEGVGVFNGDEGLITEINDSSEVIEVTFDDNKVVKYDYAQLDELELSYAITIHKSQGSEYNAIIVPVHSGPELLLSRNLLYTAITRAKSLAVLVGVPHTMERMIDNNKEIDRYTTLDKRLKHMREFIEE